MNQDNYFIDLINRHSCGEGNADDVTEIILTRKYRDNDAIINGNLFPNITHLTLWDDFDDFLDNLPSKITHLYLGNKFDRPLNNLPSTITHIFFPEDSKFNQEINMFPSSITHLTFGNAFVQSLDNLPPKITHLSLVSIIEGQTPVKLPQTLKFLSINYSCKSFYLFSLQEIEYLSIPSYSIISNLHIYSSNLKYLIIKDAYYDIDKICRNYQLLDGLVLFGCSCKLLLDDSIYISISNNEQSTYKIDNRLYFSNIKYLFYPVFSNCPFFCFTIKNKSAANRRKIVKLIPNKTYKLNEILTDEMMLVTW